MPDITVTNPSGAMQNVPDFRTMATGEGEYLRDGSESFALLRANAAITRGQVVSLVAPTATVPLSVTPMPFSTTEPRGYLGVAENSAAVGRNVRVCTRGCTLVQVGAGTPAAGNSAQTPQTVIGTPGVNATAPVAADILGSVIGYYLGAKDANGFAPVRLTQF